MSKITNRAEGIEYLRSLGHDARARDWGMGATILIPLGEEDNSSSVSVWPGMLYIYPEDDCGAAWYVTDCNYVDRAYESLEEACEGAHEFLQFITPFVRKWSR